MALVPRDRPVRDWFPSGANVRNPAPRSNTPRNWEGPQGPIRDPRYGRTELEVLEGSLSGEQRDAYLALTTLFASYGLQSLAPRILEYVQNGYGSDTITILLQQTPEYKARFKANETRKAKGLPVLSPAEYLSVESSYRQLMRTAGLPVGFYDTPADFEKFIENDVSPSEMQTRVTLASQASNLADPAVKQALSMMGIDEGAQVAYFLDAQRALPFLQKQAAIAQVGAAAIRNQLDFNQVRAEQWALQGLTPEQAQQGYGAIAGFLSEAEKLATIYGTPYDQSIAEAEVFGQSGTAQNQRKRLASQERAAFGGSAGAARGGLASRGGQV